MGMVFTLTLRTLKLNLRRTILTILTIVLSVGMMTAVLCGGWSMLQFMQDKEKSYAGDYEYIIDNLSWQQVEELKNIRNIEDISLLRFSGSSFYGVPSSKSMLAIAEINGTFIERFSLEKYLIDGRFPTSENEIILPQDFIKENDEMLSVGDTITLSVGARVWDEINTELYGLVNYLGERESFYPQTEKTYTIVGVFSDMKDSKEANPFNAFAGMETGGSFLTAFVKSGSISKAIYDEAEENAKAIGSEVTAFHSTLLLYNGITGGKGAVKILSGVGAVILALMFASSAMISNVLSISLQERMKQLGILASIGATSRQKRASVKIEALILGAIGIPLGLVFGIGLTVLVLNVVRISFQTVFTFESVVLGLHTHWLIFFLGAISGVGSLFLACRAPGHAAAKVSVIDTLKQTNVYQLKQKRMHQGKLMSIFFGVYGALAAKNIRRNPKRFRAITISIFLAVVLGLSLFSFSDFMLYQTAMDMKEDGSSYTDVVATIQYKDLPAAMKALSDDNISADISYRLSRYTTASFDKSEINPEMAGYFINGNLAEIYVVGMDDDHFFELCSENGFNVEPYHGSSNHGILLNNATGEYGTSSGRIVIGSPFAFESGYVLNLEYGDENCEPIVVQDIVNRDNANIQAQFVRDRAILIVPLSYFDWMLGNDTYIDLLIDTAQHDDATECLTNMGFFQVFDVARTTENSRQIFMLLKLIICVFAVLMTMIIGLNVCNTISNTINTRRNEFAVLRSVGMTSKGLTKTLLLEAALYGVKALTVAIPVSLIIHYIMYYLISKGMTPFMFYIGWRSYFIAIIAVIAVVVGAMLFSVRSISNVEIVKELKTGSI